LLIRCPTDTFSSMTWKPFHLLVVAISGWMNREQQQVIDYLRIENQVLREKLGNKRLILNESQKVRLATAAARLGKDLLRQWGTLFSPATLRLWHRWFVARKYDALPALEGGVVQIVDAPLSHRATGRCGRQASWPDRCR
jgi:hypothetical protein